MASVDSTLLKLKQRLVVWDTLLEKLPPEHRRLAWLLAGGLGLVLFYLVVVSPCLNLMDGWSQELAQRRLVLAKYQALAASKTKVAKVNQGIKDELAAAERQFLDGSNPALAAANLQEIIKKLAQEHGVQLTSTKILPARKAGSYREVPVQVQFSCSINELRDMLYHLEHHKKLLFIPELGINAPRTVKGDESGAFLQVNLVVSGITKKGPAVDGRPEPKTPFIS